MILLNNNPAWRVIMSPISSFFLCPLSGSCAAVLHIYPAQVARQQCFPGVLASSGASPEALLKISRCMNTWMHLRIILPGSLFATARQSLVIWRLVLPVTASCASPYGLNCRRGCSIFGYLAMWAWLHVDFKQVVIGIWSCQDHTVIVLHLICFVVVFCVLFSL